ncbi:tRNA(Ile)-lysidine synthase [Halomonas shengliensis]|uniref:tRNA(Ile)-lysidine synthase n=1 Tax=Halomonas shengliensis TaxID=419597 RepID=A0A1H0EM65_9GAMM|nr:tRNA lysidine(34) synthetase TilS [Halomonas shengliensis]SDN83389.1 tRNA(Ile)-lysidine synthase [Halomonas shengliensis]
MDHPLQSLINDALAETPPGRRVWVALSGGLDSCLLLTLAAAATRRHPRPLRALHVHHGLQEAADGFEGHCRALCEGLGVGLDVERVRVDAAGGQGLEGAAREARYAAFARRVGEGETLWLAQHRDDQAETFLLAALRGSGPRGLGAMPPGRQWQGRRLVRPLLGCSRAELTEAARWLGVAWVEDPTNAAPDQDRNYLRHAVLPRLGERWPHAAASLARSAALAAEADGLLAELAALDLARLGGDPGRLPLAGLAGLSPARRRLLVRHACAALGLPSPPARRLESLLAQQAARPDAVPRVAWPGAEGRGWRGHLYLMAPPLALPSAWASDWDGHAPLATPLGRCAVALGGAAEGERLRVAVRRGGERLRLAGRGGRDLRRLLQELAVPPWVRERLVVVWAGEAPVAVLDPQAGRWLALAEGWSAA